MREHAKITVSGDIGSGKSLICRSLRDRLKFRIVSIGDLHRKIASEYRMNTLEFNKYSENHPEIDQRCDAKLSELKDARENLIFDSRMAWHFVPASFKVYLLVDVAVAAQRIYADRLRKSETYASPEETRQKIIERQESEYGRFLQKYAVDRFDLNNYDLVVDTSYSEPEDVAGKIIRKFDRWGSFTSFDRIWLSPKSLFPLYDRQRIEDAENPQTSLDAETDGNENAIAKVVRVKQHFFIYEGHDMVSHALKSGTSHVAAEILGKNQERLVGGTTARDYVVDNLREEWIRRWEKMHSFKFQEHPHYEK